MPISKDNCLWKELFVNSPSTSHHDFIKRPGSDQFIARCQICPGTPEAAEISQCQDAFFPEIIPRHRLKKHCP